MTAEEWSVPDTPEEKKAGRRAAVEAWRVAGNSFEIEVTPIEAWARRQLAAFGFKDLAALRDADPVFTASLGDRALKYAALILRDIQIARKEIANNDAQAAARFGILIGKSYALIQDTLGWEEVGLRGKKEKANLAAGPQVASEKRTVKAAEKHAVMDKAICDLLGHRDSARWTNDQIAQFLTDRNISKLKFGPTKNIVKRIAARERAKSRKP